MNNEKKGIDFVGHKKIFFTISIALVLISLLSTFFGVNLAIEFKGGTIISYTYTGDLDSSKAKSDIESIVGTDVSIQEGKSYNGDSNILTISFSSENGLTATNQEKLTDKLKETYKDNEIELSDSNDVSPTSGINFFMKCLVAVAFATILIIIYVAFRFRKIGGWTAGTCAIIALIHDVITVYGTFVICRFAIDSNFIAAVLTILGYSVNDTIVIYDRIRENEQLMPAGTKLEDLVNLSINQSFKRSVRISLVVVVSLTIISIVGLINNLDTILSFSFPLTIGMIAGSYSSICIAAPLWVVWQNKLSKKRNKVTKKAKTA